MTHMGDKATFRDLDVQKHISDSYNLDVCAIESQQTSCSVCRMILIMYGQDN